MDSIYKRIASEFSLNCDNLGIPANKSMIRTLSNEVLNELKWMNQKREQEINIIFRGNNKLNFNDRMKDRDLIILCQILDQYSEMIKHIDISYNEITNSGCIALSGLLIKCPGLESLNLQGNKIEQQGAQALADSLKETYKLQYLNLDYNEYYDNIIINNRIRTEGAMMIIEMLFQNKSLQELNLGNNSINHDGVIGITSVLNWNNNTLQILNIDDPIYTSIGQETAIHLGKMLQSNRGLDKLSLKKHKLNDDAIYILTEHLLENNKLRVLDLTANKISFRGCEAIAKYLCGEYCVLESLILTSNRTGHYGAKAISQALSKNVPFKSFFQLFFQQRTLVHLDMVRNDIDDNGLKMISESLETNDMLVSLKLYHNNFGQMALQSFHKLRLKPRQGDWFWDFHTYIVDQHIEMAYVENIIPYDVQVSRPYVI